MKRRAVLVSAGGIGACAGFAGCLESDLSSTPLQGPGSFDQCPRWRIRIDNLPSAARREVETAIEEGYYEASPPLYLPNVLDPQHSHLFTTDPLTYYRAEVDTHGDVMRLTVDRTVPTKGHHELDVDNRSETHLGFELHIDFLEPAVSYAEVEPPERVLSESFSLGPGTSVETSAYDRLYGRYEATVVTDEHTETTTFGERHINGAQILGITVSVDDDRLLINEIPPPVRDDIVCSDYWYGDRS